MALHEAEILRTIMRCRQRIASAAWVIVRDTQVAEDIFQNVALKAMTKEVKFETEQALLSWAFVIARHEAIDWLRKHRRQDVVLDGQILDILDQEWLLASISPDDARLEALEKCLEALPEKSSGLLRLRYFDGLSCRDVAASLGLSLDAIYQRLSRLHRGLRDCIEERMVEPEGIET